MHVLYCHVYRLSYLRSDDPNEIPLDQYVFNTEAHPLPVWGSPHELEVRAKLDKMHEERRKREAQDPAFRRK